MFTRLQSNYKYREHNESQDTDNASVKEIIDGDAVLLPMDFDSALKRANGNKVFLHKMIHHMLADIEKRCGEMVGLCDKGEYKKLVVRAHGLKGSAATLSLEAITDAALQLEQYARKNDNTGSLLGIEALKNEAHRLEGFIETLDWS